MSNSDYWRKRAEILEAQTNASAGQLTAEVQHQFDSAQKTLDEQIEQWYGRFAKNNEITLAEARQWLTGKDLTEFKWDVNEYIKYGKEAALDPALIKQLENASAKFHISKLEALKMKTEMTVEKLYGQTGKQMASAFGSVYQSAYYHTIYELQQGFGIGWDIAAINEQQLEAVLSKPWTLDKTTFSDRLWKQKQSLVDEVHTQLTQNMILGKAPGNAIAAIAKKFNTSKANAGRLVMTESAYFANEAQKNAYKELEVEEFEIVGTLDSRTCPVCGALDGNHLPVGQFEAGVTAPPFHPWCRCCTAPWFEDGEDEGERIARDEDGKQYYVPRDMTYEKWKDKFVDGGDKSGLTKANNESIINVPTLTNSEVYQKLGAEHYDALHEKVKDAPDKERELWVKFEEKLKVVSSTSSVHPNCKGVRGIEMDVAQDAKGSTWSKPYQTTFHEFGHNIDYIANAEYGNKLFNIPFSYAYENGKFSNTIKREVSDRVDEIAKQMKIEFKAHADDFDWLLANGYISQWNYDFFKRNGQWVGGVPKFSKQMAYKALEKEIKALTPFEKADLSDILEGATGGKISVGFGHGTSYWKRETMLSTEAFAEMLDSTYACPESLEAIKKYLPQSYEVFQEMIDALIRG